MDSKTLIDLYLNQRIKPQEYKIKKRLAARELLDCTRKLALDLEGTVIPTDSLTDQATLLKFGEGHVHERDVVETLTKAGVKLKYTCLEFVPTGYPQSIFRADLEGATVVGVIDGYIPEWQKILEIKSTAEPLPDRPSESYLNQVEVYLRLWAVEPVDGAIILYKHRGSGEVKAFDVYPDDSRWEAIKANVRQAVAGLEANPPVKVPECRWCRYKSHCWNPKPPKPLQQQLM